jgi:hypothetical protein
MNEQTSHHRHRLSQSSNKYGSRNLIGQLMYRPCINRGNLVGRVQDNTTMRKHDVGRDKAFNLGQVKSTRALMMEMTIVQVIHTIMNTLIHMTFNNKILQLMVDGT